MSADIYRNGCFKKGMDQPARQGSGRVSKICRISYRLAQIQSNKPANIVTAQGKFLKALTKDAVDHNASEMVFSLFDEMTFCVVMPR
jgi:hypothetical protein